jgi:3',5'-cyclic AMP phosphodiesterase CpdA
MKLWAISDLHVHFPPNRAALARMPAYPEDWLALGGDVGETEEHLHATLAALVPKFAQLLWVPGNHELWTRPRREGVRGVRKYERLVEICREYGVLTPEDPYPRWPGAGAFRIAPLFVLYDYSFRPDSVPLDGAVAWAAEAGLQCMDEVLLEPEPYSSIPAWCEARVRYTEARLTQACRADDARLVIINHFPLRAQDVHLTRIPRFSIWCGTRATADWHRRFRAHVVVSGHLHVRDTSYADGCRFEEVSLGYPRQWSEERGMEAYMRQILPDPVRG